MTSDGQAAPRSISAARWLLRLALAASYLSAVADRLGAWGEPGQPGVAWGTWGAFVAYVGVLNGFLPASLYPSLAVAATALEIGIAAGLMIGWRLRWFALGSGLLATTFVLTMWLAVGVKAPLDYSVFTVAAASFYLAATTNDTRRRAHLGLGS